MPSFEDKPQASARAERPDATYAPPVGELTSGGGPNRSQGDVAHVLRSAFQATIDESVPDAMLDLLAKLS